jgi:hypothetical protein
MSDVEEAITRAPHGRRDKAAHRSIPSYAQMITRRDEVGTGSCSRNVLSWLLPPNPHA